MKNRKILAEIWQNINNHNIILLNGPRRSGKTVLMQLVKEKLIAEKISSADKMLFFDLEKSEDAALWSEQNKVFSSALPVSDKAKHFIFIDEFQNVKNIGSTLKVIHDHYPQFKLIITGSSSWYLNIDESLAGRKIVIPVWPLDFEEFLSWRAERKIVSLYSASKKDWRIIDESAIGLINNYYQEYLIYGGYPAVVLSGGADNKLKALSELLNSYVLRDIQIWNKAAGPVATRKLLALLADNSASLLNLNKLARNAQFSRAVCASRLELLSNSFIVGLLNPYFTNKIKELVKNPKIFFSDNGLMNFLLDHFSYLPSSASAGKMAENAAITDRLKNAGIREKYYFWREKTGPEVDLIIKRDNQLLPVEIKSGNQADPPAGLKSFIRQYSAKRAYILNWSEVKDISFEQCEISFRPLWFPI